MTSPPARPESAPSAGRGPEDARAVFACPECGQRQRGAAAGTVVACAGCGNPLTVPAPPKPAAEAAPAPTGRRSTIPWGRVLLAASLVAAMHLGVYLILTSDARASMADIESRHSAYDLEHAKAPGSAPPAGTDEYTAWRAREQLHQDAHVYGKDQALHSLVRNGILASFFVQAAVAGWVLARVAANTAASARRAARRK